LLEQPEEKHGDVIDFFPYCWQKVFENKGNIRNFYFFRKREFSNEYMFWPNGDNSPPKKKQKTLI
jgi:hypothetical protein